MISVFVQNVRNGQILIRRMRMEYWYEILAELACETEYGDTGIVDGKGRTYKGDNLDE